MSFHATSNVILTTLESSVNLADEEQNDLLSTANLAISISGGLTKVMQDEQETLVHIMQGGYEGIFDGGDSKNDPGFQSSDDNAVPMTQAVLSTAQSGFQSYTQTLTSILSTLTQAIQSAQQTLTQTFQFPQTTQQLQEFLSQLTSTPMTS